MARKPNPWSRPRCSNRGLRSGRPKKKAPTHSTAAALGGKRSTNSATSIIPRTSLARTPVFNSLVKPLLFIPCSGVAGGPAVADVPRWIPALKQPRIRARVQGKFRSREVRAAASEFPWFGEMQAVWGPHLARRAAPPRAAITSSSLPSRGSVARWPHPACRQCNSLPWALTTLGCGEFGTHGKICGLARPVFKKE